MSRVSAYDFSVSLGLMPLGMAMAGPIADALGLQATLLGMSAVGLAGSARLARPAVGASAAPSDVGPGATARLDALAAGPPPAVGAGGRERHA